MAFVNLIFTALNLKKLQKTLEEEKLESLKADEDKTFKKKFKFRHIGVDIREGFKNIFKKIFKCSETSYGYKTCYKLGHEGSCENYVLKSALGFIGGVFLTYLLYIFFIFQLHIILTSATVVCSILGCVLTVGLAFSSKIRCVVLLTLPQFFSKRGRQALMAYAFVLALTGPAQNTLNNLGILSESLACGQEQLKQAVKQIIDVIKKPFLAIKEAIKKVVKTVKEIVKKIKEILLKIKRVIMALVRVIKSVFEFLGKIINICNKELGTPFERCSRVFENAIADCNAKLGPLFNWLCSLAYIVKAVCYIVKVFDYVCMLVDFISDSVVGVIIRKIKIFVRHIKTMFYVRIKFSHSFKYQTITSKSMTEIAKEIVAEIKGRSRGIVAFFNFMTSASMLFFMYLVFQVAYYRIKYLTNEKFDNIYINKYFREIEHRRAKIGRETVLPLTKKEQQIYVPINSGKLARTERRKLSKAATALATASVKLATHMIADYSLYWILTMISHHARYQSKIQAPNLPVAHITGEGFLAKLLRSIVNAFQPVGIKLEIDTVPCLPIPIPPDFDRYVQIGITVVICWILTVLEPYGLRFRNYIMGYYHPLRAKQRTIWLYNHILRARTSFLLLARRNLRKKFGIKGSYSEMSCKDLLRSKLKSVSRCRPEPYGCSIFRICLGSDLQKTCLLCGEVFREQEKTKFVKCHTPRCPGLFCLECFADLKNICPICLSPIEYGDIDDLDEEKDSSGDEPPPDKPKKKRRCPWLPCGKPDDDDQEPLIPKDDEKEEEEEVPHEEEDEIFPEDEIGEHETLDILKQVAEESDSSTDYSYSYQYDDDYKNQEPFPEPISWKDLEMQAMPEEASMESFREGDESLCIDLENKIRVPKGHAAIVKMDVLAEIDEQLFGEDFNITENIEENQPLLEACTCSASISPRHVEFIGVPDSVIDVHKCVRRKIPADFLCNCPNLEDAEFDQLKSTISTSTRSDCKYCTCSNVDVQRTLKAGSETEEELQDIVPKLDLSFLEKQDKTCTCNNSVLSNRFSYVTYEEVCETSPSNRSLASSSVLSSLQNSPIVPEEDIPLLRKRNVKTQYKAPNEDASTVIQRERKNARTQYSTPEIDSPSSMDSYDFSKAQNRRVKQYYDATKRMCIDQRCQYGRKKKKSVSDMFQSLIPKRKRGQNYLPLHQRDIDNVVQIQSYNYNQENWDTFSVDTNSPTYPFGSQISTETSEEEQGLLREKRIRGGECTHLINCRLIGRQCSEKRVRSFDAKSEFILGRTKLKDFSTLSLPPKPKPVDSKELFSRYFTNKSLNQPKGTENSMKSVEVSKNIDIKPNHDSTNREDISDFIIPKDTVSALVRDVDNTPPSSDSGLSETTCAAIFGRPCPRSYRKSSSEKSEELLFVDNIETQEQPEEGARVSEVEKEESLDNDLVAKKSESIESRKSETSSQSQTHRVSVKKELLEEGPTAKKSVSKESHGSVSSGQSFKEREEGQIPSLKKELSEDGSTAKISVSKESRRSVSSGELPKEKEFESVQENIGESTTSHIEKPLAKRKSTQLNQLLYKDDRTEISLVQKLSPDKGTTKSKSAHTEGTSLSPRAAPSVKLKISLHNSIIPEEDPEESLEDFPGFMQEPERIIMRSPKSQDKIVETRDSFPLQRDWLSSDTSKTGKLILSSDKTQQTSDNDIYRNFKEPESSGERRFSTIKERSSSGLESSVSVHTHPQISTTTDSSHHSAQQRPRMSSTYYTSELPERDAFCKNECKCLICKEKQINLQQGPSHARYNLAHGEAICSCCRCADAMGNQEVPSRSTYQEFLSQPASRNFPEYDVTVFPPSSTDTEIPEYLPPPPPIPSYPPKLLRPRAPPQPRPHTAYIRGCNEQCNCYERQRYSNFPGYSGDSSQRSVANRYSSQMNNYGYQGNYDPRYNCPYGNYEYESPNPDFSLPDLPYQNNEEYMELVNELQDTLHSRNRSRVKRAMQEFEDRSKQNKPLEKPIINYDESSESEEPIMRKIDQLRTDRKICCAEDQCSCVKKREPKSYPKQRKETGRRQSLEAEQRPSHWTMDPGSGEWLKGCKHKKYRGPKGSKEPADCDQCTCNCDRRYQ